jgi:hypothetical protein
MKELKTKLDITLFIAMILEYNRDEPHNLMLLVEEYKKGLYEIV